VERGHVARRQPISCSASGLVLIGSLPYTLACTAKSVSGTAGGFIGRQPVTNKAILPFFGRSKDTVNIKYKFIKALKCGS
jgi:hypothetical protein